MRSNRLAGVFGAIILASAVFGIGTSLASAGAMHIKRSAGSSHGSDPLRGWKLFSSPNTPAAADVASFRAQQLTHDTELMERISRQQTTAWLTDDANDVLREVTGLKGDAEKQGAAAVIVAYDIPGRGCTEDVGASEHEYLRWIREIAAGIGTRHTIVILEPDAIPFAISGCAINVKLMGSAVKELVRAAGARVYIDAGNPSWVTPVERLVAPLREADISQAAGFSLNVANFQTNAANITYGHELSRLLGGAHFVIDTGRNGNGPDTNPADAPTYCIPPGRALGSPPTTNA